MDSLFDNIRTESDVEQKIVYPLLTKNPPLGLGFLPENVHTKHDIRQFSIGKGKDKKLYYPDYIITLSGLPLIVVEAKEPGADPKEGYREARLYASELNAEFPPSINPVSTIICTNGVSLLAGDWDSSSPNHILNIQDIDSANQKFATFLEEICVSNFEKFSTKLLKELTQKTFFRPTKLLGGSSVRNEEIGHNSFGSSLSFEYRYLFNPTTEEERAYIAKHAYIPSQRRERYIESIDKIIRAAAPPSEADSRLVEDTGKPKEIIDILGQKQLLDHQTLLLIGGVGAGKSTFVDYLREVALPSTLSKTLLWVHINMNHAPVNFEYIYDWVCEQIILSLKKSQKNIDFEELETIKKVYSVELNRLIKGPLKLLPEDSIDYKKALANEIIRLQNDNKNTAKILSRYCCSERAKKLIIVLDNCDKRIRDEQLLMFQVAQWLQSEFRGLILLPLREETYDNHRNEAPLDTALKPGFRKACFD